MHRYLLVLWVVGLVGLTPDWSRGMIVAGARGGGDNQNNTTQAELEALPQVSDGHFFNNVFTLGIGNGVYIGYKNTVDGPVGYALSGMHLDDFAGGFTSLTIQGLSYTVEEVISVDDSDLALISFTRTDQQMPSLKALTLSSTSIVDGTDVIMIGAGRNRVQDATTDADETDAVTVTNGTGYTTTTPRLKRWGTNSTADFESPGQPGPLRTVDLGGRDTVTFRTIFDEPAEGEWLITNQAQGVNGDSGGGVFSHDGLLLGIMVAVQAPDFNQARFGNTTLMADIATYKSFIDEETGGMLIPEPGTALLLLAGLGALACHRRSHR